MVKIFFLSVLICLTACSDGAETEPQVEPPKTIEKTLKKDIPNDFWVKIYFEGFETTSIDEDGKTVKINKHGGLDDTASENDLSILRKIVLIDDDLEIRIWVGFGLYGNDALILRRSSGNWSAVNLREMLCHLENRGRYDLDQPKSGWEKFWKKLTDAEILTLPDSSKLDYGIGPEDGKSYVVETNFNNLYRTYHYPNPEEVKLKEAGQMVKIGQIIADEFGLESFSAKTGGCKYDE